MFGEPFQFACRAAASACLACFVFSTSVSPAAANSAAARDLLVKQKGLVEQRGHWVLPLELELRRDFASLRSLKVELQRAKQATEQTYQIVAQRNADAEAQIANISVRLRLRMAQDIAGLGAGQRRLLSEQISRDRTQLEEWQQQWIDPVKLGGFEPLKRQIVRLTNHRNELATTILKIHEERQIVTERYEHLAQDLQVRAALKALGEGQRLGPLNDYHAKSYLAKIAEYEREVFTSELPLYRDGDDLRVSGIIGRTPVTFTWLESSEPTTLTASVIEATGLEVPQNAPQMQRRLPDGREVTVRQFEVPYMRFGNQLLRSVQAYALPPEAENAGTQIGPSAFEGLSPKAEPQNLRLVIQ